MSLRNVAKLRLPHVKKSASQCTIFYNGLKIFNELPGDISLSTNVNVFKKS